MTHTSTSNSVFMHKKSPPGSGNHVFKVNSYILICAKRMEGYRSIKVADNDSLLVE